MKVYYGLEEFETVANPIVTTGTFDGVHIGHQKILQNLVKTAEKEKGETVIITFFPHPRLVLYPDSHELKLINTQEEKIELLDKNKIDHLIIQPFTREFSRKSSIEYIRDVLVNKIGTKILVIGYNHHFGRNREGSFEHLKEYGPVYGFQVREIPAQDIDNIHVSSTKIRDALGEGDIRTANAYLGYQFSLRGKVIGGSKIGRSLGFPTANIEVPNKHKLIPKNGVYAVEVILHETIYKGMLNIGQRPTVDSSKDLSIEVNIFDFENMIYEENITIKFVERIRDEKKFDDMDALKKQLEIDKNRSINILT